MIFTNKSDFMRYAQQQVAHGYHLFTSGTVPFKNRKAEALALKFSDRYGTEEPRWTRARKKAKGEANAVLLMLPFVEKVTGERKLYWLLLATKGTGLVTELEQLEDLTNKKTRLEFLGYELVKVPKTKNPEYPDKAVKPAWSWRYTDESFKNYKDAISGAIKRNLDLEPVIASLRGTLGFHASRQQAFDLYDFAIGNWERFKSDSWPFSDKLTLTYYGRFKTPRTCLFSDLNSIKHWQ